MKAELIYVTVFLVSVFVSSASQIVLKKSADRKYENRVKEYLNMPVMVAYGLFFCSSLMTVMAYRGVPLSMGPVLEATGYLWVSILGVLFLKERISKKKAIGLLVLVIGVLVFNIS